MKRTIKCCVPQCPGTGSIFYKFPIPGWESKTIEEWVRRIGYNILYRMDENKMYSLYRVCDLHFSEHCRVPDKTRLRKGSLPTLFVPGFKGKSDATTSLMPLSKKPAENVSKIEQSTEKKPFFRSLKSKLDLKLCEVCRICLVPIKDKDFVKLYEEQHVRNMLAQVLPNLNQNLYPNSVICFKCKNVVCASFELRETSNTTEEKLKIILKEETYTLQKDAEHIDLIIPDVTEGTLALCDHTYYRKTHQKENVSDPEVKSSYCDSSNMWGKGPYLCHKCGIFIKHIGTFKYHLGKHFPKPRPVSREGMCHMCGKVFRNVGDLYKHFKTHKIERKCGQCNIVFSNYRALQIHKKNHHPNGYYQCHICGKTLSNRSSFKTHLMIHDGERKFVCEICNKKFLLKTTLMKHVHKHTDIKCKCPQCDKVFKHKWSMKAHFKAFHTNCVYECEICLQRFWYNNTLVKHKIRIHGWIPHSETQS